jgi:hypothetical protein
LRGSHDRPPQADRGIEMSITYYRLIGVAAILLAWAVFAFWE